MEPSCPKLGKLGLIDVNQVWIWLELACFMRNVVLYDLVSRRHWPTSRILNSPRIRDTITTQPAWGSAPLVKALFEQPKIDQFSMEFATGNFGFFDGKSCFRWKLWRKMICWNWNREPISQNFLRTFVTNWTLRHKKF